MLQSMKVQCNEGLGILGTQLIQQRLAPVGNPCKIRLGSGECPIRHLPPAEHGGSPFSP